ncbi:uncharacterized protein FFUJ_01105 [Fusarium fujikuroi IMI 58289]|uniref:SnoaL-like domain-containing protein n=1 Tax=Gibberella fujikuroi (strain CBS 195.34 / IMI 58289 / NRRL A-6831) TaxID=1279085 RepID=S0DSF5_GIBF5|nr:LOW QUALITY PROTEIN: uncharacterized protein FFUJ_01105 [Fusarium fujikuroi IMI 58289]CCT63493.1 uncharacterized protein FFUJ_01105 [Fusarium fujikuroi IMI 58289]
MAAPLADAKLSQSLQSIVDKNEIRSVIYLDRMAQLQVLRLHRHNINEADGQETWITFLVRYVDQFEKRDGSWKISHRFVAFDVVSGKAIMQYLPKANLGTRDEEDYSRKVLKD